MKTRSRKNADWRLLGAVKDRQTIDLNWEFTDQRLIEGVSVREVKNVPKRTGWLTEVFRREWAPNLPGVDQVFQATLFPGAISAWHAHAETTDRLFVSMGTMKIVLFDARPRSRTRGLVCEFLAGEKRPALIIIPPRVFHGVQNIGPEPSLLLNLVDKAYRYKDPDHWRLPKDCKEIPYRFGSGEKR